MNKILCIVLFAIVGQLHATNNFCPVSLVPQVNACEGETVTLDGTTFASGYSYQWFMDNTPIPGETNALLTVTQGGVYRVDVTNGTTSCTDESIVTFFDAIDFNMPPDLVICDDDNDGFTVFDLTVQDAIITNNNPEYSVSYHVSAVDADNQANPIIGPYVNTTNPQTIFVRIENQNESCIEFTNFDLIVNFPPDIVNPSPLMACDDNGDGITQFNLVDKDAEITGGLIEYEVSYFLTEADAQNNVNPLLSPFTNTVNPQIVFVRVIDTENSCLAFTTLQLDPIVTDGGTPIDLTEEDPDNDGIAIFDLTENTPVILNGQNSSFYAVTYFETQQNAIDSIMPINTNATAYMNVSNPQTIYTRFSSLLVECFEVSNFDISAEFMPAPDEDNDGVPDEDEDLNNNGNLEDDNTDGDDLPNYRDSDDDGDLVATIDEIRGIGAGRFVNGNRIFIDTDNDMIENYLDDDDDGDLVLTKDEDYNGNGNPIDDDTNNNSIPDFLDEDAALGVDEVFMSSLNLFPNPAASVVTISSSQLGAQARIVVYNTEGKIVLENESVFEVHNTTVSVSTLKAGVYFLKVISEGKQAILKFVKE